MNQEVIKIDLPKIIDERGNLSYFENGSQLPFDIKRVYWIYDVPGGETRGGHAYKKQKEFITVLSGSIDIVIKNKLGEEKKVCLNRSYKGLYLPNGVWKHMENFSTNALALIVSDSFFCEEDYIRDWNEYISY